MRFGAGLWCLQATATTPRHHVRTYEQLLEDVRLLDRLGYDSAWLSEHHFFYDGYCPSLLPAAAAALAVTERLRLGTGMLLLPLHDARRVATMAAALRERFGDRLLLGVSLGYRDVEFDGKGVRRKERVSRFAGGLDVLEEHLPGMPLWVGSAAPAGIARAAERGHGVLFSGGNPLPLVRELAAVHRRRWEEAGRPGGARPRLAALRNVWVTESRTEREEVLDWVRASYVLYAGLGWAVAAQGDSAPMNFREDAERALRDAVATTIIGSAPEVTEGLRAVAEAGVDDVVFRVVIEGAPQAAVHRVLQRLADEVMPELAGVEAP